ncbi:hypothetical protein EMIHUDRAFT_104224 [Emiliania huxleyi CCMP1516]|uniref:SAP domain-containing protein n=2 Tax=Emiliania huxleyi TaxID=2903 RepID=A0A0D3IM62_EMIH1|nr:hypothetical protein EMIHUDRAFT_104224 [Emiliania huxleyi CCMP1516]EOD12347.1 hypothetical protein EMIHUDRAFT_104224 [Emiliania huxleyi CCMP1516]|eukprot:XP_005764776.1 hypothetical protein EMIHUDRAFT_104224 [Emiliania huxleyi CCMP1516]
MLVCLVAALALAPPLARVLPATRRVPLPVVASAAAGKTLAELKVYELKAVCKAKGLKVSGKKADLVRRIELSAQGIIDAPRRGPRRASAAPAAPPAATASAATPSPPAAATPAPPAAAAPAASQRRPLDPPAELATRAAPVDADVLSAEEGYAADRAAERVRRRGERRAKLQSYVDEEYLKVTGELASAAGAPYGLLTQVEAVRLLDEAPPVELSVALPAARLHSDAAAARGRRLGWCSGFDASSGTGTLVDLEEKAVWRLDLASLAVSRGVPPAERALSVGEFVEYEPAAAAEFAAGGAPPPWVQGILGWPLMCEARATGAEALLSGRQ